METQRFGQLLAKLRKQRGLTQKQLAEQFNISDKSVSKWERGETMPDITLLPEIADYFQITVDELLSGEINREPKHISLDIERGEKSCRVSTKSYKIILILLDLFLVTTFAIWLAVGFFTDNGWKDVLFSLCMILYALAIFANFLSFERKNFQYQVVTKSKNIQNAIFFLHCLVVAILFLLCSGLFNTKEQILCASTVTASILITILCVLNSNSKFVQFIIKYKVGGIVFAVVVASLCLFAPFCQLVADEPDFVLEINTLSAFTYSLGLKGAIPFFAILLVATAYTAIAFCKNFPAFTIVIAWLCVAIASVVICNLAENNLIVAYSNNLSSLGVIENCTSGLLIYGGIIVTAISITLHICIKRKNKTSQNCKITY